MVSERTKPKTLIATQSTLAEPEAYNLDSTKFKGVAPKR